MSYRELTPPAALHGIARCVWTFEADFGRTTHDECILPDGFPELIVHLGTPYREHDANAQNRWRAQPRLLFAGNLTRPLVLQSTGRVFVLGVRLWPQMAARFVEAPVAATLDARLPLTLPARGRTRDALHALASSHSQRAACDAAAALVSAWTRDDFREDAIVRDVVHAVVESGGQGQLREWTRGSALSERQIERRMTAATGLSPKMFASIVRFRRVFDELQAKRPSPWLHAAIESGYFDQAHMVRSFKRFAGQSPGELLKSAGMLSSALVDLPNGDKVTAMSDSYKTGQPPRT